uniref:Uncharacterized protein n=1 Tax=Anguilla anguilla TaxID=7936 RepID=A0A0E9P8Q9_ANGAN
MLLIVGAVSPYIGYEYFFRLKGVLFWFWWVIVSLRFRKSKPLFLGFYPKLSS